MRPAMQATVREFILMAVSCVTLASAIVVVFSRNIVRSAFSLFGTLAGVAALYVFLEAELLAGVQVLVYVGGIQVLILFGVMLIPQSYEVEVSRPAWKTFPAFMVLAGLGWILYRTVAALPPETSWVGREAGGMRAIGDALLGPYLLPFELISLLLVGALIGAVVWVRQVVR